MARQCGRRRILFATVSVFGLLSTWMLSAWPTAVQAQSVQSLDTISVTATKTPETAVDSLAPISIITLDTINRVSAKRLSDIFYATPGVSFEDRGDSPETAVNIRGMQDFGRVAVVVDGARQNYQRSGHNANGSFFLEPELLGSVDVVRGPTANIYGSGAIGGVVSFRTKDADDILQPGERFATAFAGMAGSNSGRGLGSVFSAGRPNPNVDYIVGGTYRTQSNYKDGDGYEIANTANHFGTALAKLTVRPLEGHELKFGGIFQETTFNIGQFNRGPIGGTGAPLTLLNQGSSVYASDVQNTTGTVRWKYYRPEDKLLNFDINVYSNRTENDQTKIYHNSTTSQVGICPAGVPGNAISGCIGDRRSYVLNTLGFDAHNNTRFDIGEWRNVFTYGGDMFQDDVTTWDERGNSNITTPGGVRTVSGAFFQWKSNYSSWLEVVSAARYDKYELESTNIRSTGERVSPKITVGITPIKGVTPYVSYAEGYRAPSITETLIAGYHAQPFNGPAFFNCPGGGGGLFCFLQNPYLRPEIGKTSEAGLNLKYDNIFSGGDSFRGKFNVFRNNLEDYIELTASPPELSNFGTMASKFYQYQNIPRAHIQGFEAETMYDAGAWFLGISGQIQRGYNDITNNGLVNVQPNKIVTTGGVRLLDRKMTLGASWVSVASNQHIPQQTYIPNSSYDLLNFFLTYEPVKDLWVNFTVDNALNRYYRPYAVPRSASDGSTQNDVLWSAPPPGIVYKGTVRIRFSAM
jgi:hemoglobin/transferrin/lactoferrin receptor protein